MSRMFVRSRSLVLAVGLLSAAGPAFAAHVTHAHAMSRMPARSQPVANMVVMKTFNFAPMTMTVPAGTTVIWKNLDGEPHTVVSTGGVFRSPALDENDTFKFKFDKPGTYTYLCSIHPKMMASIIVK